MVREKMSALEYLTDHYEYEEGQNYFRFEKVVDVIPASKKRAANGLVASVFIIPENKWYWVTSEDELIDVAMNHIDFYKDRPMQKKTFIGKGLNDNSPMPFGKHQGEKMINVPAAYLIWIFENNKCSPAVAAYISKNLDTLRKQAANDKKGIR